MTTGQNKNIQILTNFILMKILKLWLSRWYNWKRPKLKTIIIIFIACIIIRLIPYFIPIHAVDIQQQQLASSYRDRNGLALGTILTRDQEHTSVVPLNQVSAQFLNAIIAAEDSSYYHHGALDTKAIFRAIKDSIQAKRITSGASTITMQLARMVDNCPRTLIGKLQEIWYSWRLFAGMNKTEILAAYVNRLPMGGNIYGVEAAARTYFSIPASDVNLAQASLLAALPNNPSYFDPFKYWQRLKKRQKYVLNRMVQDKYITSQEAQKAYEEKVVFQSRQRGIIAAPHFLFWLTTQKPPSDSNVVNTTIDRRLQQFVEAQVKQVISSLANNNVNDAAALVVDNHTGEILAYVGSPDYFNESQLGRNDGVQALRQPGSTLKPFLYELALEKNVIRPNTILADIPAHYAIPGAKLYSPTDYSKNFLGPVRVRIALANSLNVPAVRVLEKVGVDSFLNRLHELGFIHLNQTPEYYGLGLTLGSGEVSLWELAQAYLAIARQGNPIPLITTLQNQQTNNQTLNTNNQKPEWQLITDILSDNHARATAFGVDSVLNLPFPAAVKTGTSSNYRDTWTVGFTSDYTVATWVGNFNGEAMRQVSGVTGAAPLWNRIMLHLHEHQEPEKFPSPSGLIQLPICAISGLKPTSDCSLVVQEYLYPEDITAYETAKPFKLPAEYDEWLAKQNQSNLSNQFKIASPQNGDRFLLYPGEENKQKLEFQLASPMNIPVEWWLNGEKLTASTNSVFWQLRPGKWTLEAKSGAISDRVSFEVEVGVKSTRRGFSLKAGN